MSFRVNGQRPAQAQAAKSGLLRRLQLASRALASALVALKFETHLLAFL
jgi:hypothetical protein